MLSLIDAIERHVLAGSYLHVDNTPVPVLDPGRGKQSRADYGYIFAMNGLMAATYRQPPFIAIRLIARACIRRRS
ncbi:hypothetical protein CSC3H3_01275 [Thalassospira marina]|uniref:Transposase IS66 central domain-containing protein n=1 Tax=Thalassospira marina TaxID=2048283 RepID=A0ABM6Q4U1_9PROT|nr:hypothetical protein CSC3H3_01275 [Thalassospira marina]